MFQEAKTLLLEQVAYRRYALAQNVTRGGRLPDVRSRLSPQMQLGPVSERQGLLYPVAGGRDALSGERRRYPPAWVQESSSDKKYCGFRFSFPSRFMDWLTKP
jgi:hypothetical protein